MTVRDPETPASTFASLGLSDAIARAALEMGHDAPTPVQAAAIPAVLSGRDVWASAPTGSGKTGAFVMPLLDLVATMGARRGARRSVRGLVLVPTRELAAQVADAIDRYGCRLASKPKTCVAVGGVSINPQMMALRGGADVVVATPGRLLDLADHNAVDLSSVELLVLDEADRLLSLGFADELARVMAMLPRGQRLLFSATFPAAVCALAEAFLVKPRRIAVAAGAALGDPEAIIVHRAIAVDASRRTMLLRHLLAEHPWPQVLVFVASRYAAEHVTDKLTRAHVPAAALHGDRSQGARTEALADFRAGRVRVLVATDVAARGLDVVGLPVVVNYDLPRSPTDYLHRTGRTGRAGMAGIAISFVTAAAEAHLGLIEKRHALQMDRETIPGFERTEAAAPVRDAHGGVKGKRKSKKDKLREAGKR